MVLDHELSGQRGYGLANKMSTLIAGKIKWASKPGNNDFKDEFGSGLGRTILHQFCFIPPGQVISCDNYISENVVIRHGKAL